MQWKLKSHRYIIIYYVLNSGKREMLNLYMHEILFTNYCQMYTAKVAQKCFWSDILVSLHRLSAITTVYFDTRGWEGILCSIAPLHWILSRHRAILTQLYKDTYIYFISVIWHIFVNSLFNEKKTWCSTWLNCDKWDKEGFVSQGSFLF